MSRFQKATILMLLCWLMKINGTGTTRKHGNHSYAFSGPISLYLHQLLSKDSTNLTGLISVYKILCGAYSPHPPAEAICCRVIILLNVRPACLPVMLTRWPWYPWQQASLAAQAKPRCERIYFPSDVMLTSWPQAASGDQVSARTLGSYKPISRHGSLKANAT